MIESKDNTPSQDNVTPADPQPQRSSKRGPVIALVALVIVLAVGFFAYDVLSSSHGKASSSSSAAAKSEWAAPSGTGPMLADYDATVYTETGTPTAFSEIADGKPLVINFWATWCPYCVQEMPDYLDIYHDYESRVSFAFVDCADGSRETVSKASAWLSDNGFGDLPAYYDTKSEAQYMYGASSLPTTVVVSADGEVMTVSPGMIDADLLRSALDSLL
ncbi:MAG: TlpA family protein disulfide reductase [Eggerthellaceae bacterium]|nr:TlpA family protein disulfide reductase [Eggerthellaceae bacterium]